MGSPADHHSIFLDFSEDDGNKDEEQPQSATDEDAETDLPPQWPQSYRKSMDIYSHMASPGLSFLGSDLHIGSFRASQTDITLTTPLLPELVSEIEPEQLGLRQRKPDIKSEPDSSIVDIPPEEGRVPNRFADCHGPLPANGCTFVQSTLNGINVLAGVGVLSTPYALKEGGWIGLLLLSIFAATCCYTGILLRRCLDSAPGLATYPDIGQAAFGRIGRIIVSIVLYTELYTCCVEFLILEGDNLATIFSTSQFIIAGHTLAPTKVFAIIAMLVILPTVWLRDMSLLSYISAGGVLTSMIVVLSVFWVGAVDGVGFHHSGHLVNFSRLPVAIGLFGFCFSGHAVFPNIYSSMQNGAHFNRVLQVCFILCILMYGGVAVMGFTMFGDQTLSQVTLNLPKEFYASKLALWTTVITPIAKYALTITPVAMSLEELLPQRISKNHWASIVIRTGLVISTLAVALVIPFFGYVMAFIGSFLSLTGSLILPCACYLSIQRRQISRLQIAVCVATIFVGVVAACAGTYSSISGIIGQFKHA